MPRVSDAFLRAGYGPRKWILWSGAGLIFFVLLFASWRLALGADGSLALTMLEFLTSRLSDPDCSAPVAVLTAICMTGNRGEIVCAVSSVSHKASPVV